jgi:chemotaxis protein methyltransferase WspC
MSPTDDDILPEIMRLLAERAGMATESFGVSVIAHAVRRRIATSGAASSREYLRRLFVDQAEFQELLEELVVPETWFFRDALALSGLVSRLAASRSLKPKMIRVLSVGCSTGEEVYTLAIALREAGFETTQFLIFGTDVSKRSLGLAQKGNYTSRSFRENDKTIDALCHKSCEYVGESRQIREELRVGVEFHWGNLAQPDYLTGVAPFQVIFCRNVLIYFHVEARRIAIGHLQRLLASDGLLYSTAAEARIFSEAGFCSLGSECPFAFRLQSQPANSMKGNVAAPSLPLKSEPRFGDPAFRPPVPLRSISAITAPLSLDQGDQRKPGSAGKTFPEEASGQAFLQAAQQAADSGRLEDADALCGQALSQDPVNAGAYYLRGVVRQAQGALNEAQQSLEKALYLDPKHYQALVHMMLLAEQRGDERAAANYRRRAQQATQPEVM